MDEWLVTQLIELLPSGAILIDENKKIQLVNQKFIELFKPKKEVVGELFQLEDFCVEFIEDELRKEEKCIVTSKESKDLFFLLEQDLIDKKGVQKGRILCFEQANHVPFPLKRIESNNNIDYLTGLDNRLSLYQYFENLPLTMSNHFLFLDIDNFKIVNDVYGHSVGDDLLVMIASNLSGCAPNMFISRIGGDEFVIVIPGTETEEKVIKVVNRILSTVAHMDYRKDILTIISMSIGIVFNQKPTIDLDDVLNKCDLAMYCAKENGKNQYVIYNQIETEVMKKRSIEDEMHHALAKGEFIIYLQPKMNMLTSQLCGAEALVRWQHPVDGLRMPDSFINIFEKTGFIVDLDLYVFEEVCRLKKDKKKSMFRNMRISVNMSRLHFYREDFIGKLRSLIQKYEVNPNEIEIEITENIFLRRDKEVLERVNALKELGFFIAVDDFGSGYSSLNILKDIQADILKIDREFLHTNEDDLKSKLVIKNIVAMGKDLNLEIIVEGVETLDQVLFLTSCGCSLAQGYFYSRPLPIKEFKQFASRHQTSKARHFHFSFDQNLWDDGKAYEAIYQGGNLNYVKGPLKNSYAVSLLGGGRNENVISIPAHALSSESYTICIWVKSEAPNIWCSLIFAEYDNGFFSLAPMAWEGSSVFRIKDNRSVNGWYDAMTCSMLQDQWMHVAITYDEKSRVSRYYSNGRQVSFKENVPPLRVISELTVGGDPFQKSFQGCVAALDLYEETKAPYEIETIYWNYVKQMEE